MNSLLTNTSDDYAGLLEAAGVPFKKEGPWLMSISPIPILPEWDIFLSLKTEFVEDFIAVLSQLQAEFKPVFKIIEGRVAHRQINDGRNSSLNGVPAICLHAPNKSAFDKLIIQLESKTKSFRGPVLQNKTRLGSVLYIDPVLAVSLDLDSRAYHAKRKSKFIDRKYLIHSVLRTSEKGNVYKAINLKNMSWCIIKQALCGKGEDDQYREIKDRLDWQRNVLQKLQCQIRVPKIIDCFEYQDDSYLVLEYIDGLTLHETVMGHRKSRQWKCLPKTYKTFLAGIYLKVVDAVASIHAAGFIHRDITDGNFIFTQKDKIACIDFELAWSYEDNKPDPPFVRGSEGFASPEQLADSPPNFEDDIYSLGAVLLFILTGQHPKEWVRIEMHELEKCLSIATEDRHLVHLAMACIHHHPARRPSIQIIAEMVTDYINHSNNLSIENFYISYEAR